MGEKNKWKKKKKKKKTFLKNFWHNYKNFLIQKILKLFN
jgi:hypothetical protein